MVHWRQPLPAWPANNSARYVSRSVDSCKTLRLVTWRFHHTIARDGHLLYARFLCRLCCYWDRGSACAHWMALW
jgi:hypothetical protein